MRGNKYGSKRTFLNGRWFHSKAEARRYEYLSIRQHVGEISALQCQPSFTISIEGHKIGNYVADFLYTENGKTVIEDVKGVSTELFKWKAKLFRALYPHLELRIIPAKSC